MPRAEERPLSDRDTFHGSTDPEIRKKLLDHAFFQGSAQKGDEIKQEKCPLCGGRALSGWRRKRRIVSECENCGFADNGVNYL